MRKLLASLGVFLALALSGCGYNSLQSSDEQIKASWSEVLNQYQRRADLVPNLVSTVKGEAKFEQDTLTKVVDARARATSIQAKLRKAGDLAAVAILDVILRDEIGHVAIGNHWYGWLCRRDGLDAEVLYPQLVARYAAPRLRGPFNLVARRAAGFSEGELAGLQATH